MFNEHYFQTTFPRDLDATGTHPQVEIQLLSGHAHRVRAILEISASSVTLETYHAKGDLTHERPRFGDTADDGRQRETYRAVVAYEAIAAVIFDPTTAQARARPGFANT